MECRNVDRLMDTFLDGELDAAAGRELKAHMTACVRCRREWGGLVLLLTSPAPVEVPHGLRDRIVAAINPADTQAVAAPASGRWHTRLVRLRYAGAIAACVMFFLSGWLLSGWWAAPKPDVAGPDAYPSPEPRAVVVSPWILSSLAQAAAAPVPLNPAVVLARGVLPEMVIMEQPAEEPRIRIYRPDFSRPGTQPADGPEVDLQILPFVPRYPGA